MGDLTLLYSTANRIDEGVRERIANNLLEATRGQYPIISVSQKTIGLGRNICVGDIGQSKYNFFKQVLIGARLVKTEYVACVDDDVLYAPEHFLYRPGNTFSYETNYWFLLPERDKFFWRVHQEEKRGGMWGCICKTELLVSNLSRRYDLYPTDPFVQEGTPWLVWGEPGIADEFYGMKSNFIKHASQEPCLVFVHKEAMGTRQLSRFHRRYGHPLPEDTRKKLPRFGSVEQVVNKYFGGN